MQAHQSNRYPGARPFSPDQQHLFFGREKAVRELYGLIQLQQLIILYSKSGLGKSSLLNAGILPLVEQEGRLTTLNIRFNAWTENKTEMPAQIAREAIRKGYEQQTFLEKIYPDDRSLWYAAKTRQLNDTKSGVSKGLLLVFDQFEELFTYPEEAIQQFGRQFAELLQTAVPQRVRKMTELFRIAQPDLISNEDEDALEQRMTIRIVCAIRSDRMSLLDILKPQVPQILANRYELQSLSKTEARAAIVQPAKMAGDFISLPFEYTPQALDTMLGYLTRGGPVESFQLQILCQSVEQKVIDENDTYIDHNDIGDPEEVFRNYYDNQIARIEDREEQLAARRLIEEGLVYEKEQRRLTLYEGQIRDDFEISDDLLRRLVDTHLLRAEPSLRGGYTYELSHDTLVVPVLKAKVRRVESEQKALEAAEAAAREAELANERRKKRRAYMLAIAGFVLSVLSIAALIYALGQRRKADEAKQKAEQALSQFKIEQAARNRLEIEKRLQNAAVYRKAGALDLAIGELEQGMAIDSANIDLATRMQEYRLLQSR
ncbi:MAG: hypothetical protein IPK76_08020 [Lewinellaceae bacterium]|nr:hypothetical protein [Lewinellaceae bacterium]